MKKNWLKLIASLFCIFLFVTQIGHVLNKITAYQKIQEVIELKTIDAGSLFYTESEAADEADFYFKHHRLYE